MARGRGRKTTRQPVSRRNNRNEGGVTLDNKEEPFKDHEGKSRVVDWHFSKINMYDKFVGQEHLDYDLDIRNSISELWFQLRRQGRDGQYEVKWKEKDVNLSLNHADERTLDASLLHRLSIAYPDFSAGIPSLGAFEFSNKSVKTSLLGADKLQIRSLVLEEPSDSQILELKDGLRTPNVSNNRLSLGITPKTLRLPRCGEMLLSVHGLPLGVYKEDKTETIKETEDG